MVRFLLVCSVLLFGFSARAEPVFEEYPIGFDRKLNLVLTRFHDDDGPKLLFRIYDLKKRQRLDLSGIDPWALSLSGTGRHNGKTLNGYQRRVYTESQAEASRAFDWDELPSADGRTVDERIEESKKRADRIKKNTLLGFNKLFNTQFEVFRYWDQGLEVHCNDSEDYDRSCELTLNGKPVFDFGGRLGEFISRLKNGQSAKQIAERVNGVGLDFYRQGKRLRAASYFRLAAQIDPLSTSAVVNFASVLPGPDGLKYEASCRAQVGCSLSAHERSDLYRFDSSRWLILLYALHLDSQYTKAKLQSDPDLREQPLAMVLPEKDRFTFDDYDYWSATDLDRDAEVMRRDVFCSKGVTAKYASGVRFRGVLPPLKWSCEPVEALQSKVNKKTRKSK